MKENDYYNILHDFHGYMTEEMEDRFLRMIYGITESARDVKQSQSQDKVPLPTGAE
jgi:hypothetical protein